MTKKNAYMFFLAATASVVAVFIFLGATPHANAYEIGTGTAATAGSSYDFGNSLQNLISPFKGFVNDLQWTDDNSTSIDLHLTGTPLPPLNIASGLENIVRQWFVEFDNWFDRSTGIQLSGVIILVLNIISWTLHAAEDVVNWLLGLFH